GPEGKELICRSPAQGAKLKGVGGNVGTVAGSFSASLHPPGFAQGHDGGGKRLYVRRRPWACGSGAIYDRTCSAGGAIRRRAQAGRSLYGRHLGGRARLDRRPACDRLPSGVDSGAALGVAATSRPLSVPAAAAVQFPVPRPPQRRAPLRSRRPALLAV